MSVNYPKGVRPKAQGDVIQKGKKGKAHIKIDPGNRGMAFESAINESNQWYIDHDVALVTKRPTPINVVNVDYSKGAIITQAYFEKQSTTDYNGVYKGRYLDFEAKSTISKTSFPLSNIPSQQIEHLERVLAHGGIAFFIIEFASFNEVYILPASYMISFYRKRERQSLPIEDIKANGYKVKEGYAPRYDYLEVVEKYFLK